MKMNATFGYHHYKSPVGKLLLIRAPLGLYALLWENDSETRVQVPENLTRTADDPLLKETQRQLQDYFSGKLRSFTLPLAPAGTAFQIQAWKILGGIPYGETISYQEQAQKLGDKKKARAIGAANGRNPISIIVPCHRVVGKNGDLTGFAGGLQTKQYLLEFERQAAYRQKAS